MGAKRWKRRDVKGVWAFGAINMALRWSLRMDWERWALKKKEARSAETGPNRKQN